MISASKTTFSHYNLNILRPEVTKNIKNLRKKFCEFRPWSFRGFQCFVIVDPQNRKSKHSKTGFGQFGDPKVSVCDQKVGRDPLVEKHCL